MSLKNIFKEITNDQLKYMEQYGAKIVGWKFSKKYEMLLYKDPHLEKFTDGKVKFQVGFQRKNKNFTNMDQVMSKSIPDDISFSELRKFEKQIKKWLDEYKSIGVGSNNRRKAESYERIFKRLGFNVKTQEVNVEGEQQLLVYLVQ